MAALLRRLLLFVRCHWSWPPGPSRCHFCSAAVASPLGPLPPEFTVGSPHCRDCSAAAAAFPFVGHRYRGRRPLAPPSTPKFSASRQGVPASLPLPPVTPLSAGHL
ncbi:unnamed protein product [Urochloa humidicola]